MFALSFPRPLLIPAAIVVLRAGPSSLPVMTTGLLLVGLVRLVALAVPLPRPLFRAYPT